MEPREVLVDTIQWTRHMTLETFCDLEVSERLFQPAAGLNHPLWLLGHIALSEARTLHRCTGQSLLPEGYGPLFGMGSSLLENPAGYPSGEEILERMVAVHSGIVDYACGATDAELAERPVDYAEMNEHAKGLFPTRYKTLWFHPMHESLHAGQIAYIRRLLGKPYRI